MGRMTGWIAVDLDSTIAFYPTGKDITHIGPPIEPMCARVRGWLEAGVTVKIMTARAGLREEDPDTWQKFWVNWVIWSTREFGTVLQVTDRKDFSMIELYDDRAVSIESNTGRILTEGREDD